MKRARANGWWRLGLVVLVLLATAGSALGQPAPGARAYHADFASIQALGRDMHRSLSPGYQGLISPHPISLETSMSPSVRMLYQTDGTRAARGLWVSEGFIELVNRVAHALAIDKRHKGYFSRYMVHLENAASYAPPLPDGRNPDFWTPEMLNEQESNFNSIMGLVAGIGLAHHCRGHYDKYHSRLKDAAGEALPINNLVTRSEWEEAWREGMLNSLNAGCMSEGVMPFLDAIDRSKQRPSWAAWFIPDGVRFSSMRREMAKVQRQFLRQ